MRLGCDLELAEDRSQAFTTDYFTSEEQALLERATREDRPTLLALLWSAKESALKALGEGLRLDTRSVVVTLEDEPDISGWSPLQVRCPDSQIFHGWWRNGDEFICTVVSDSVPECPIALRVPESTFSSQDAEPPSSGVKDKVLAGSTS